MTKSKPKTKDTKTNVEKMIDEVVKKDVEALRVRSKLNAGLCSTCVHCNSCRQG